MWGKFIDCFMQCASDVDQIEWYGIRDMLLGQNGKKRNIARALQLAAACKHQQACSLTKLVEGRAIETLKDLLQALEPGFADESISMFAFLDAWICSEGGAMTDPTMFELGLKGALEGERDGFALLGYCFAKGKGCAKDMNRAQQNYLLAAELGNAEAMSRYAAFHGEGSVERWEWESRAALEGCSDSFSALFAQQVFLHQFDLMPCLSPVIYVIGRCLHGQIDAEKKEIFGRQSPDFDLLVGPAKQAIDFFIAQCAAARAAVDTWALVALRVGNNKVNRDIRKKIGLLIWIARHLAEYKV